MPPQNTGRRRAQRLYPSPLGLCEDCHGWSATERHHLDGDVYRNTRENIAFLCHLCHARRHKLQEDRPI